MIFNDRFDAGTKLALKLKEYKNDSDSIIVAIPRGGVEIAFSVCRELNLPMEIIITKKIGAPSNSELAIGAISENNTVILNNFLIENYNISRIYIEKEIQEQKKEIEKRLKIYRQGKLMVNMKDKNVIIVDDGIATGATVKVAIQLIKKNNARKIVVATPVAERETVEEIRKICDEVVCLLIPDFFYAVGSFYKDFKQVSEKEVVNFISKTKENYDNEN